MIQRVAKAFHLGRWLPMLFWMAAIFFMSNQPAAALPVYGPWDWLVKKGGHFLAYALLAALAFWTAREGARPYLLAFLIAFTYAVSDEFHQLFVDGRHGTAVDVMIDSLGAFTALLFIYATQPHIKKTILK